jgi:hypothetical protein
MKIEGFPWHLGGSKKLINALQKTSASLRLCVKQAEQRHPKKS